jgi:hypothetical protein
MKLAQCLLMGLVLTACNMVPGTPVTGVWRSIAAEVTLTEQGGSIVFGCASGQFDAPVILNARNEFRVSGTYTLGSPVPPPPGTPPPTPQPLVYTGTVVGDLLTFTGTLENGTSLGTVKVVRNGTENVVICA